MIELAPNAICIRVPAVPVAQPRPRATLAHGGKGARMHEVTHIKQADGSRKPHPIAAFKATVIQCSQSSYRGAPMACPLLVTLDFVFPRPKSMIWAKKPMPRARHAKKPDIDNLAKSVLDAMNQIVWIDDSQVVGCTINKWIAAGDEQPHVFITIVEAGL